MDSGKPAAPAARTRRRPPRAAAVAERRDDDPMEQARVEQSLRAARESSRALAEDVAQARTGSGFHAAVEALETDYAFERWLPPDAHGNVAIRLVTSWATPPAAVDAFLADAAALLAPGAASPIRTAAAPLLER